MKQIIIVTPKSISSIDKQKLSKAGMIVIEHPDPNTVRIVTPVELGDHANIAIAAMEAIKSDFTGSVAEKFGKALAKNIIEQQSTKPEE